MLVVLALSAFVAAEPEADPALLTYGAVGYAGYPYTTYAGVPVVHSAVVPKVTVKAAAPVVTAPVVKTVASPVVSPVVYNTAVHHAVNPVVYNAAAPVVAAGTHVVTNYNNPEQYTAVSAGVYGPSYIAKNGPVAHIVKREADAEADAAVLYAAHGYAGYPFAGAYGYGYPYAGYAHHAAVAPAVTYAAAPALVKTPDHAVAATGFGYTHSSNVGICTNVNGVQVPC